ncbi:hypothetical protein L3V86_07820 [Thiotrichales bacterium 19S11-10]|nr:hypothetical protein [Thiotrichales bacterium 19S11-10]
MDTTKFDRIRQIIDYAKGFNQDEIRDVENKDLLKKNITAFIGNIDSYTDDGANLSFGEALYFEFLVRITAPEIIKDPNFKSLITLRLKDINNLDQEDINLQSEVLYKVSQYFSNCQEKKKQALSNYQSKIDQLSADCDDKFKQLEASYDADLEKFDQNLSAKLEIADKQSIMTIEQIETKYNQKIEVEQNTLKAQVEKQKKVLLDIANIYYKGGKISDLSFVSHNTTGIFKSLNGGSITYFNLVFSDYFKIENQAVILRNDIEFNFENIVNHILGVCRENRNRVQTSKSYGKLAEALKIEINNIGYNIGFAIESQGIRDIKNYRLFRNMDSEESIQQLATEKDQSIVLERVRLDNEKKELQVENIKLKSNCQRAYQKEKFKLNQQQDSQKNGFYKQCISELESQDQLMLFGVTREYVRYITTLNAESILGGSVPVQSKIFNPDDYCLTLDLADIDNRDYVYDYILDQINQPEIDNNYIINMHTYLIKTQEETLVNPVGIFKISRFERQVSKGDDHIDCSHSWFDIEKAMTKRIAKNLRRTFFNNPKGFNEEKDKLIKENPFLVQHQSFLTSREEKANESISSRMSTLLLSPRKPKMPYHFWQIGVSPQALNLNYQKNNI